MKESFNLKEDPFNEEKNKATKAHPFHSHKIGRNEPCPCGSGKKYKKCCGKDLEEKTDK